MKTNFIFSERPLPWNKLRRYPWQWTLSSLLLLSPMATFAQQQQVEGKVQTSNDKPIAGASITDLRTGQTTSSDGQGRFKINASPGDKLVITFVGYRKTEMIVGQQRLMDVLLNEDNTDLEEVVVVGYGTQKKASLTGAISSVNNKEITVTKNENVVNMLAGKMPGVRISQQSSQPGSFESNIDIRGMGEPLIVVDGIPRDKDYLSRMDANEIESVSVLKDASAAVYGVRSANGVLLVTTRRGSNEDGNFEINYSYNRAWQKFLYVPNTVDALAYMQLKNEQIGRDFNSNYPAKMPNIFGPADFEAYQNGIKKTSNYVDAAFDKVSPQYQHNLSINGGGKKVNYFFNLGHMDQMGAYKSKSLNYNRWNFRSNIDAQITDRLKASLDLGGYADETNQPRTDIWAVYKQAWRQRPIVPIYVNDNPLYPNFEMIDNENPVVVTDSKQTGYRKFLRKQFNGIIALDYKVPFVEGLNAKATYNYDFKYSDNTDFKKSYFLYSYTPPVYDGNGQIITPEKYNAHEKNAPTTVRRSSYPDTHSLMQFSLNYNRRFAEKHQVSGLLLFVEEYNKWDSFYAQREIMVNSEYLFAGEDKNQLANMEGIGERTARGLVGKFNYDYLGKYIAEFSFRYDGSSKFPKESRWGFFPAASVGWRISEEGFIKNNYNFINNLKIRASYGKLGDDRSAGNYPSTIVGYALEPNETGWIFGGNLVNGALPTAIPNPNLTWYTSKTADVGLDMDLWNGKLGLTFDYFNRNRSGLLATSLDLIPGTVGANLPQENLESDRTFGYELSLTHRNKINDFNYFINAQVSSTKSQFVNRVESKAGNSYDNWRNRYSNRNKDIWWGKEYAGQFGSYEQIYNHPTLVSSGTLPGDYYYQDWNGDGVINDADNHPIATYNMPLINYGFTLGGSWRGLDLTMNFQGAAKVYVQYSEVLAGPLQFDGGALTQFLDRWRPVDAGTDLFNPSTQWLAGYYPSTGSAMAEGTRAVQNASYLRLKTLELGYSLPQQWLKTLKIKNLRIYASAYNLLTWTGLKYTDPEHPGSAGGSSSGDIDVYKYPINKTYNIGASIKF
ncbi:TonB-dependent receptor [Sphingobacterium sp.]|uniref:SusC/RagA family TonB-linked outer membrane protein n=1 Tax=Sphingobacterium sp. TaxID=341027 RepID=UPI00289C7CEE|nr:TonB-dependent receptor [Sphingobacterium sp.]